MEATGRMKNLLTAIFGEDADTEEMTKQIMERKAKEREEAFKQAREIMAENRIDVRDLPMSLFVSVAASAVMRQVEVLEGELAFGKMIQDDDALKDTLIREASGLVHAGACYDKVCELFKSASELSPEEQARYSRAMETAKDICGRAGEKFSHKEVAIYAYSVFEYAVHEFYGKENQTLEDAERLIASYVVKENVLRMFRPYNVRKGEDRLHELEKHNHYKRLEGLPPEAMEMTIPAYAKANRELYERASEEIEKLMDHTEEAFQYRLNYIKSGRTKYSVWQWHGEIDDPEADISKGTLWAEEKGEYETKEEAVSMAGEDDEIGDYDPDEMWAIVDPDGKNPTSMIYPSKERAAIFLIGLLGRDRMPNWYAWEEYLDKIEREESKHAEE